MTQPPGSDRYERKRRLRSVDVKVTMPNEYTNWRPRIERGYGWTAWRCGIFHLAVER